MTIQVGPGSTAPATERRLPRLLIADDDPVVRHTVGAQVEGQFLVVGAAQNTGEAIALAAEHRPDVALIDIDMPGGGGLEAVRRISQTSPETCLVILSADEIHDHVVELLNAGAVTYLRKGISAAKVNQTLEDSIRAHARGAA